ncbi:crotonase/enoyl-CoA hydratase family protein [Pseudarthrobacter sp. NPDC055928]|uniref:crotonase/enoyl-CoA hydratase family protein n=1 Tax=Pseudarthrobacter sp. NPDC055928 TaxID=3345661 RepID=UPI0035DFE9AC
MDQYETLSYEVQDGILTLWLDRPRQLNAFTVEMAAELVGAFDRASSDDEVIAVVVTGRGRAFCAGMDLTSPGNVFGLDESLRPTLEDVQQRFDDDPVLHGVRDPGGRVTWAIFNCTKPVIGAVNGSAVGIGATMTCAMDARLVSTDARIGFVFGRLGIVPEASSSWFLPRIVGLDTALDLMYSADILNASEAREIGLVRSVHEPNDLLPAAYDLARRYTRGRSPVSVALTRQMLYRNAALASPLEASRIESLAMFYTSIGDGKEGVAAFLEKRTPRFTESTNEMPPFYPWW